MRHVNVQKLFGKEAYSKRVTGYVMALQVSFSERGASEAAAGRFASVAAKLVKTATQIPIYIRVK